MKTLKMIYYIFKFSFLKKRAKKIELIKEYKLKYRLWCEIFNIEFQKELLKTFYKIKLNK